MTDKKRYYVTLTQDKAFITKRYLKELGLPSQHFSILIDEYLDQINPVLKRIVEGKKTGKQITMLEIMNLASKSAEDILNKNKY